MRVASEVLKLMPLRSGYKVSHNFPNYICPKVNVIEWLEFEPAYSNVVVQYISYYTTTDSL